MSLRPAHVYYIKIYIVYNILNRIIAGVSLALSFFHFFNALQTSPFVRIVIILRARASSTLTTVNRNYLIVTEPPPPTAAV